MFKIFLSHKSYHKNEEFDKDLLMKKRCPFCHGEMEIPESAEASGFCRCGAYGQISLLSKAHHFSERAKKALGIEFSRTGRVVEMVDGGIVFEEKGEPAVIQWARKPG
jgi:hypothetical protein